MTKMRVVCAWCGADMGEKDGQGETGVSHGMCEDCYNRASFEKAQSHPFSKEARLLNRHLYAINHKGSWCLILRRTCQEGICAECEVWLQFKQGNL